MWLRIPKNAETAEIGMRPANERQCGPNPTTGNESESAQRRPSGAIVTYTMISRSRFRNSAPSATESRGGKTLKRYSRRGG